MELTTAIISSIAGIIVAAISASAYITSHREEAKLKAKTRRDETRRKLALQIIGYFYEEDLMAQELSQYTKEPVKSIKERMRKNAESHSDNKENSYPKMTAQKAREYILK